MSALLPMFTCKICKTRLLERDCAGHLQRHGLAIAPEDVLKRFDRGKPEVAAQPGAALKPTFQKKKRRGTAPAAAEPEIDEDGDLN